ncbi:MAG: VIT family protein [Myxococcaceae bacterium]|nr:MAG: VIT family protein [Myxococcaceae bacterium]
MSRLHHPERHRTGRAAWLRAAVMGANDGIVSTASLLVGVAAAQSNRTALLVAGGAGLVAGAMSMAAGEYVSVSSQADLEAADLALEEAELLADPAHEKAELAGIYVAKGLSPELAAEVAQQLTEHDALGAHRRDELGMSESSVARPGQAALSSAATFTVGAALPMVAAALSPSRLVLPVLVVTTLVFLAALGALSARMGGAPVLKATARVVVLGSLAMALTAAVGRLFGATV